jgi:hypothetical protein
MSVRHGTANRYNTGCRCDACKASHARRAADYRQRKITGEVVTMSPPDQNCSPETSGPGPVELGVQAEIDGLASEARPGLAQAALALARILDNPKAVNQQPAAAKVLASLLEKLRSVSASGRRGNLALVKSMTKKSGV